MCSDKRKTESRQIFYQSVGGRTVIGWYRVEEVGLREDFLEVKRLSVFES